MRWRCSTGGGTHVAAAAILLTPRGAVPRYGRPQGRRGRYDRHRARLPVQLAQPTDQEVALRTTDDIEQLAGMAQQAEMPATDLEKLLRSPRPLEG